MSTITGISQFSPVAPRFAGRTDYTVHSAERLNPDLKALIQSFPTNDALSIARDGVSWGIEATTDGELTLTIREGATYQIVYKEVHIGHNRPFSALFDHRTGDLIGVTYDHKDESYRRLFGGDLPKISDAEGRAIVNHFFSHPGIVSEISRYVAQGGSKGEKH